MNDGKILVFIPTYNERENVEKICSEIIKVCPDVDLLFMDDNSSDGTGIIIDGLARKHQNVKIIHRPRKMGIGSAHIEGIKWAYDKGYSHLITMDCDFTHSPKRLPAFIKNSKDCDIVVGSRYIMKNSLNGWIFFRKFLTQTGHFLTTYCLGMPYDATGAFRLYRLDKIPRHAFDFIRSKGYSFFFESLYILSINGFSVKELPIILLPRTYGHSKMNYKDAFHSLSCLVRIYLGISFNRSQCKIFHVAGLNDRLALRSGMSDWDEYWESKKCAKGLLYDGAASFYRKFIIQPSLNYFIKKYFSRGSRLLHAGCGSGQMDVKIVKKFSIVALDNSICALNIYKRLNKDRAEVIQGDIFDIPFDSYKFDGIYNLGVFEHFTEEQINNILLEFHRILKSDGKVVIFWPPIFGVSVVFLKFLRLVMRKILRKNIRLHPEEITLVKSKAQINPIFERANFKIIEYYFGPKDFFTHVVIVAEKKNEMRRDNA